MLYNTSTSLSRSDDHNRQVALYYQQYCHLHDNQPIFITKQLLSDFQESELEESLSGVVHDQCSCNFNPNWHAQMMVRGPLSQLLWHTFVTVMMWLLLTWSLHSGARLTLMVLMLWSRLVELLQLSVKSVHLLVMVLAMLPILSMLAAQEGSLREYLLEVS